MSWKAANEKRQMTDAQYIEKLKSLCVVDANGCWLYQRFLHPKGYGSMSYRGKQWRTHRLSYHLHKGAIPAGMLVCHTCDVRHCCNPDHLWLGSNDENQLDAWQKGRKRAQSATHCERGHEYTPENTRRYSPHYRRVCLICTRARTRIKAGWPEELAYSTERVSSGYRPVQASWKHMRRS